MADRRREYDDQRQLQHMQGQRPVESIKDYIHDKGPSTPQVLALITLLPVGGTLLALSGMTLIGTLIGLAVSTPVFLLFSPIIVPAAIVIALAVVGFLTSGAFGLTALSSLSWIMNYFRAASQKAPEQIDWAKRRMADAAARVGDRTKDVGQTIQQKAHDTARS